MSRALLDELTVTDLFCGAGGSSIGAELAGGTLRLGLNHWARAIETHATNFQHADHDCADVSALTTSQIRRYPDTDILLASPECTNHSLAKGARRRKPQASSLFEDGPAGDDEQDRSRATMWDVVRFAEQKILKGRPYKAIIVENVIDAFRWGEDDNGQLFAAWRQAMIALGYEHEIVWLNSMFCPPTPQSRDRMYVVFWRRGIRRPNLDVEPPSWCPRCERVVEGRQSWKQGRPEQRSKPVGARYGPQYLYTCPDCHGTVLPGAFPAATAIDWALPAERIGDRTKPLAPATRERIRRGLERLAREPFAIRLLHGGNPRPLTLPLVTLTERHDVGVVLPVAGNTFERTPGNRARRADLQPADTVHTTLDRALVVPAGGSRRRETTDADAPHPTLTRTESSALVMANTENGVPRPADREPAQTLRTEGGLAMVTRTGHKGTSRLAPRDADRESTLAATTQGDLAVVLSNRANNIPRKAEREPTHPVLTGEHLGVVAVQKHGGVRSIDDPVHTVRAGGRHHGIVVAHFDPGWARRADDEPFGSITTRDHHTLVVPYNRTGAARDADADPSPTLLSRDTTAVAWGDEDIDDCRFRMFELHEIADTMVMRRHVDGNEYIVLGNKRERMAQYGNAVTPPAMRLLLDRVIEVLA